VIFNPRCPDGEEREIPRLGGERVCVLSFTLLPFELRKTHELVFHQLLLRKREGGFRFRFRFRFGFGFGFGFGLCAGGYGCKPSLSPFFFLSLPLSLSHTHTHFLGL